MGIAHPSINTKSKMQLLAKS